MLVTKWLSRLKRMEVGTLEDAREASCSYMVVVIVKAKEGTKPQARLQGSQ